MVTTWWRELRTGTWHMPCPFKFCNNHSACTHRHQLLLWNSNHFTIAELELGFHNRETGEKKHTHPIYIVSNHSFLLILLLCRYSWILLKEMQLNSVYLQMYSPSTRFISNKICAYTMYHIPALCIYSPLSINTRIVKSRFTAGSSVVRA